MICSRAEASVIRQFVSQRVLHWNFTFLIDFRFRFYTFLIDFSFQFYNVTVLILNFHFNDCNAEPMILQNLLINTLRLLSEQFFEAKELQLDIQVDRTQGLLCGNICDAAAIGASYRKNMSTGRV